MSETPQQAQFDEDAILQQERQYFNDLRLRLLKFEPKLYVSNLDASTTAAEVQNYFEDYGTVRRVHMLPKSQLQTTNGVAFIHYWATDDAAAAIEGLHGKVRDKQCPDTLVVRWEKTVEPLFEQVYSATPSLRLVQQDDPSTTTKAASRRADGKVTSSIPPPPPAVTAQANMIPQYYMPQAPMPPPPAPLPVVTQQRAMIPQQQQQQDISANPALLALAMQNPSLLTNPQIVQALTGSAGTQPPARNPAPAVQNTAVQNNAALIAQLSTAGLDPTTLATILTAILPGSAASSTAAVAVPVSATGLPAWQQQQQQPRNDQGDKFKSCRVIVSNLRSGVENEHLNYWFSPYGKITEIRQATLYHSATITYEDPNCAYLAADQTNGKIVGDLGLGGGVLDVRLKNVKGGPRSANTAAATTTAGMTTAASIIPTVYSPLQQQTMMAAMSQQQTQIPMGYPAPPPPQGTKVVSNQRVYPPYQ